MWEKGNLPPLLPPPNFYCLSLEAKLVPKRLPPALFPRSAPLKGSLDSGPAASGTQEAGLSGVNPPILSGRDGGWGGEERSIPEGLLWRKRVMIKSECQRGETFSQDNGLLRLKEYQPGSALCGKGMSRPGVKDLLSNQQSQCLGRACHSQLPARPSPFVRDMLMQKKHAHCVSNSLQG